MTEIRIDPRIEAYIAQAAPFAQPILRHLRAVVHRALPGIEETIKWSMPHFMLGGKNVAGMAAFKALARLRSTVKAGMARRARMPRRAWATMGGSPTSPICPLNPS